MLLYITVFLVIFYYILLFSVSIFLLHSIPFPLSKSFQNYFQDYHSSFSLSIILLPLSHTQKGLEHAIGKKENGWAPPRTKNQNHFNFCKIKLNTITNEGWLFKRWLQNRGYRSSKWLLRMEAKYLLNDRAGVLV